MDVTSKTEEIARPDAMPLPGDPLNRYWLELAGVNPQLVEDFRPVLVTFLAFDKDRSVTPMTTVGTGFVIGTNDKAGLAFVLTAKHVLDGVHGVQTPRQRHAESAYFVPDAYTQPTLHPERLKVAWMGSTSAGCLNAIHANYNLSTDIACCIVARQEADDLAFSSPHLLIDPRVPAVGEIVHMVSIDNMSAVEMAEPEDRTGRGQVMQVSRRVSIRRGTVTSVHPNGFGQYRWPCFTTSIPAAGGMSGGFVFVPRDGETIAACGVVCADLDPYQSQTDQTQCGTSVVGCIWPALGLRLPLTNPAPPGAPDRALLDMARAGDLSMPVGGVDGFTLETLDNGDYRLHRR